MLTNRYPSLPSEHCVDATTAHQHAACPPRPVWRGGRHCFGFHIVWPHPAGWLVSPWGRPAPSPLQSRPRRQRSSGSQPANVMLGKDDLVCNIDLPLVLLLHAELPAAVFQGEQLLQTKIPVCFDSEITYIQPACALRVLGL